MNQGQTVFVRIGLSCRQMNIVILLVLFCLAASGCASKQAKTPESMSKGVRARMDLAASYISKDQPRLSLKELMAIKGQADDLPFYHHLVGLTYMQLKSFEESRDAYKQAVRLDKDFGPGWNNLGRVYILLGEKEKAMQCFEKAIKIPTYMTPEFSAFNLSRLYQREGELQKAEKYARLAIEKNWRYLPAYTLLVNLLINQGKTEEASRWVEKGVEAFPDNPNLMLLLAENKMRSGNNSDAIYWFKRIIEVSPDSEEAKVARDYLEIMF